MGRAETIASARSDAGEDSTVRWLAADGRCQHAFTGDRPAYAIVYIAVDDPVAYLAKAVANGAQKLMDVETVPGMVTFAMFRDLAGNVVGIIADETPPAP